MTSLTVYDSDGVIVGCRLNNDADMFADYRQVFACTLGAFLRKIRDQGNRLTVALQLLHRIVLCRRCMTDFHNPASSVLLKKAAKMQTETCPY